MHPPLQLLGLQTFKLCFLSNIEIRINLERLYLYFYVSLYSIHVGKTTINKVAVEIKEIGCMLKERERDE